MIRKMSKPVALDRHELNYYLCIIGKYGPMVALGIIATLSVGAVYLLYRIRRGQRKTDVPQVVETGGEESHGDKFAEKQKENREAQHSQKGHTVELREALSVPSNDQCIDTHAATVYSLDQPVAEGCHSNSVSEGPDHIPAYLSMHVITQEEHPKVHPEDLTGHLGDHRHQVSSHKSHLLTHDKDPGDRSQPAYVDQEHLGSHHEYLCKSSEVRDADVKIQQREKNQHVSVEGQLEEKYETDGDMKEATVSNHQEPTVLEMGNDYRESRNVEQGLINSMNHQQEKDYETKVMNRVEVTMNNITAQEYPSNQSLGKDAEEGSERNVDDMEGKVTGQMQDNGVKSEIDHHGDGWLNTSSAEVSESFSEVHMDNTERQHLAPSDRSGHPNLDIMKDFRTASPDGDPISKKVAAVQPLLQSVKVSFKTHFVTQSPSQVLAVTGNLQELGEWERIFPLRKGQDGFWVDSISLPVNRQVEWKFILVENGKIQRWEECSNRRLETGCDGDIYLHKWWGYH